MAYNFVVTESKLILIISDEFVVEPLSVAYSAEAKSGWLQLWTRYQNRCQLLTALRQNLGGYNCELDSKMETVLTRWLITQDMEPYYRGIETQFRDMMNDNFGGEYVEMLRNSSTIRCDFRF